MIQLVMSAKITHFFREVIKLDRRFLGNFEMIDLQKRGASQFVMMDRIDL